MRNERDKDQNIWNMFERVGMHRGSMLYRNVEDGEWKDSSVTEVKGTFKWYLLILAVIFAVSTVVNYNYLGGIEGILTSEMLGYGKESIESYIAALGSMIVMPILAVVCLVLAFKKKKKRSSDNE